MGSFLSYPEYLAEKFEEVGIHLEQFACPLSERELQITELVALGWGNGEIAHHLQISRQTVKNHMSNILRKTGGESRLDVAMIALGYGWISTDVIPAVVGRLQLNRSRSHLW